jgi:hypothetical protein
LPVRLRQGGEAGHQCPDSLIPPNARAKALRYGHRLHDLAAAYRRLRLAVPVMPHARSGWQTPPPGILAALRTGPSAARRDTRPTGPFANVGLGPGRPQWTGPETRWRAVCRRRPHGRSGRKSRLPGHVGRFYHWHTRGGDCSSNPKPHARRNADEFSSGKRTEAHLLSELPWTWGIASFLLYLPTYRLKPARPATRALAVQPKLKCECPSVQYPRVGWRRPAERILDDASCIVRTSSGLAARV